MEKQKKWQLSLILVVIALTLYHILPTVIYYCQPLKNPLTAAQSEKIGGKIAERVNHLEQEAKEWILSYCDLLRAKPKSIVAEGPHLLVTFVKSEEAARFRRFLPRAGSLIPFLPAQLSLPPQEESGNTVIVQRQISELIDPKDFSFAPLDSPLYRELILDRAAQIAYSLSGPSETAWAISHLDPRYLEPLAAQIHSIAEMEKSNKAVANRFAMNLTQAPFADRPGTIKALLTAFGHFREELKKQSGQEKREELIAKAEHFLREREGIFSFGQDPYTLEQIKALLKEKDTLFLGSKNPLFSELSIDWATRQIRLKLHSDFLPSQFEQPLINEVAKITRLTDESFTVKEGEYTVALHHTPSFSGYLALNLDQIGARQVARIEALLRANWHPQHPDLQNMPIVQASQFPSLTAEQKALCLVIHPPSEAKRSLSISAYGLDQILQNYEAFPHSEQAQLFSTDFRALSTLLEQNGFQGYRGLNREIAFEKRDGSPFLLAASREDFAVKGTGKFALLELSNLEQRLLVENRIDTQIHEDLLKWRDEYNAAQVSMQPQAHFDIPPPTKSVFWSNLALSARKFFRGDERKVIHWGLDLSGGKTVQIELRDANHQLVKGDEEIKQGINELYQRVNKMGVSEVAIRQLGHHIVLDFPSSQMLSASELIKASSMYFHIVNEKFSSPQSPYASLVQRFLSEVWNEAVVTQRQDAESVNLIAWKRLHADTPSETARALLAYGLTLQSPLAPEMNSSLEETTSKIAVLRGEGRNHDWFGQSHPLLLVFSHYALEGSQLERVQGNYDPQKGNYLSFEVQKGKARDDLQAWTSRYAKEKILGTSLEDYSKGRGWRMAVILNDTVISAPSLEAVIRDSATISGSFSQREVRQLVSDMKAGSLTFTPHILSEKNVSPELGQKDRLKGITATSVALLLVMGSMILYYRFAGLVASIAVLFNLLILWATLQNIGATLSLAGIAGIILTVGMAVDANVLVFERFKEEFSHSGRLASAMAAGYKKAYSAIVDSNVTTIIAALILLNFDAGPIKGFAITLIIGIVSSMFTALFMTRYYFTGWIQNPKHQTLNMANWIRAKSIDFLKQAKLAFLIATTLILVGGYFVYAHRATIFGMDFTGGFSLYLELEPRAEGDYLASLEKGLLQNGATPQDFQLRELNPAHHVRILLGTSMEQPGKPFYNLPLQTEQKTNPRIDWVIQAIQTQGLKVSPSSLAEIESNWTAMSGQMSDSMRNNALIGLLISFVCIFIYIAFRFEYKFAAASILCLLHDVLITVGLMGLLHALGVPVQIDLNTVAALMTIVGYSLNDTIIIFDRIREEMQLYRHKPLFQVVNSALNATLSRTTITSGTTLLVLIALVSLGGPTIFSFALVMTIGVFFGTLSSWYIASPLMLFFHSREEVKERKLVKS